MPSDPDYRRSTQALAVSPRFMQIIKRAEVLASHLPDLQIGCSHLLMAICEEAGGATAEALRSFAITPERLRVTLLDLRAAQHDQPAAQTEQDAGAWAQGIEQRLAHLEAEFAALRALLTNPS
jgi:ATP-dependent Clp protease ATP-binding subunit ClpA